MLPLLLLLLLCGIFQPQLVQEGEDLRSIRLQLHGIVAEGGERLLHAAVEVGIVAAVDRGGGIFIAVQIYGVVSDRALYRLIDKFRAVFQVALRLIGRVLLRHLGGDVVLSAQLKILFLGDVAVGQRGQRHDSLVELPVLRRAACFHQTVQKAVPVDLLDGGVLVIKPQPVGRAAPLQLLPHAPLHGLHDLSGATLGIGIAALVVLLRPDGVAVRPQLVIDSWLLLPLPFGEAAERAVQIVGVRTHLLYLPLHLLHRGIHRLFGQVHSGVFALRQRLEQKVIINISHIRHSTVLLCR